MQKMIWSGQGPVYFGKYDPVNGTPEMGYMTNIYQIGCANRKLTTTPSRETRRVKESCSGQRLDIMEVETSKELNVSLEMVEFDRETLARAFFATSTLQAGGTVTAETFPTVAEGDIVFLKHAGASSIVLTDSTMDGETPDPQALTAEGEGRNYRVIDASQGTIQILDLDGIVQPIKAAYTYASYGNIAAFTATNVRTGIIFAGKNQDGHKARVIIPNISLSMSGEFNWMAEEESVLAMEGPAFYVPELDTESGLYGPFMRIDALPD